MEITNSLCIAVVETREACKGKKSLKARLKAAMDFAKSHWLVTNDGERLWAAVTATVLEGDKKQSKELCVEWKAICNLENILRGGGTLASLEGIDLPKKPLDILKLWEASKANG